ncbi:hypothetical protein WISP_05585 [Willisornis vidua]|uniref:Uncharacterized protein n=1 Tax=Willisornis vidua TaxID=1566151 RepID=A0ABQ9DW20_9PASS|nr:hypothetical protein WISP_05585 [Willisornis vidua]
MVVAPLRKGIKLMQSSSQKIEVITSERNSSADATASGEGRGGAHCAAHGEAAVPLQPMEVHGGVHVHLQPLEDPKPQQVGAWRRLWLHWKPMLEQAPGRTQEEDPVLEQDCWKDL